MGLVKTSVAGVAGACELVLDALVQPALGGACSEQFARVGLGPWRERRAQTDYQVGWRKDRDLFRKRQVTGLQRS